MKAWPKVALGELISRQKRKIASWPAISRTTLMTIGQRRFFVKVEPHFSGDAVCIDQLILPKMVSPSVQASSWFLHTQWRFCCRFNRLCLCLQQVSRSRDGLLRSTPFDDFCKSVQLMQGTANMSMKVQDIAGVEIPVPPFAEQQAIVARLNSLAEKTRQLEAHLDAVDQDSCGLVTMPTFRFVSGPAD
ncbi:MAG: restriction endonuclease subunit S [Betaproteobacteria bacterium]|nr:restriction endonuclease subunit S [Candidatus Dechloromonas phosphorivorans]